MDETQTTRIGNVSPSLEQPRAKIEYITLASVVSMFAVVFLHSNDVFWAYDLETWMSANIIESVFYFAVPVFFMISGATLMDYRERYSTKQFFFKRAQKTLIPFFIWSVIALIYRLGMKEISPSELSFHYIWNGIFGTRFLDFYWFFPSLFCVYLCMPLFSAVPKEKRLGVFTYLAVAGFVINCLIPFFNNVFSLGLVFPFTVSVVIGNLLFTVVGYLLHTYAMPKKLEITVYVLAVAGLLTHILGTYFASRGAGYIMSTYKGYVNLPCVLYSVGVFLLFKRVGNAVMSTRVGKPIRFLGSYTFAVYLMHFYAMRAVRVFLLEKTLHVSQTHLACRLAAPFLIVPLCVLAAYIIRKIPIVRRMIP